MKALAYERATDPQAAQALRTAHPGSQFIAGGTNLVDLMKLGVARPDLLIDINRLPYGAIDHRPDGSTLIGATVRNADLAGDAGIRERFPLVAQALLAGASGQLRSAATTGGNLLQRTRCVYFQDTTKPCNKRSPGSGCSAIGGAHRDLGLLATSEHCVATHPSDLAVSLVALDAVVHVQRASGVQEAIALTELHVAPGDTPQRETVLEPGDLITAVELPAGAGGARMRYRKVRDRWSYAFALVSVAAVFTLDDDGRLVDPRIGLGGVASRPWRARHAEAELTGAFPTADAVRSALRAEFARADARPLPDNAFKIELAADTAAAAFGELTDTEDEHR